MNMRPSLRSASSVLLSFVAAFAASCAATGLGGDDAGPRNFDPTMVFPSDRSLARPEDGIALADGRLIVADQIYGLRLVERDGAHRPFGDLPGAGYLHDPPPRFGAANGVSLEPAGTHLLVTDIFGGGIYRVAVEDGATERVYLHRFGVNTASRDSTGAIWFTQSARNTPEQGGSGISLALNPPVPTGALWRVPMRDGRLAEKAELVRDGFYFANGLVLDEARGRLYLAELGRDRVLEFRLDVAGGRIDAQSTLLTVPSPDNLETDRRGRLWVVLPRRNEALVVDLDAETVSFAFRAQTPAQAAAAEEYFFRGRLMPPRRDSSSLTTPLPGMITGVILGTTDDTVYITGLGDALIRLDG